MTLPHSSFTQLSGGSSTRADASAQLPILLRQLSSSPGAREHIQHYASSQYVLRDSEATDCAIVVIDGWIECSKSLADGEKQIIDFLLPGDSIDPRQGSGARSHLDIRAVIDSRVAAIPAAAWKHFVLGSSGVVEEVQRTEAARAARIQERMLRLGKSIATVRVAYILIEFLERLQAKGLADNYAFHLPLAQKHIGEYAGLTMVHVCRTLRSFVKEGLIEISGHMDVKITNPMKLAEIAQASLGWLPAGMRDRKRGLDPSSARLG